MRQTQVYWGCTVSETMNDLVNNFLSSSTINTRSEFIRDCVRRRLEEMGYLKPTKMAEEG